MGVVEEVGSAVTRVRAGDRVVIPFVIVCGACFFCERSLFAACESTSDGRGAIFNKKSMRPAAALFGYTQLYGGVPGGHAEFVRVPMAAACARMLGAVRIFIVDEHAYRLKFAADTYGAEPIHFSQVDDPAQAIIEHTQFRGVDASIDAAGFEAKGSTIETVLANLKLEGGSGDVLR